MQTIWMYSLRLSSRSREIQEHPEDPIEDFTRRSLDGEGHPASWEEASAETAVPTRGPHPNSPYFPVFHLPCSRVPSLQHGSTSS